MLITTSPLLLEGQPGLHRAWTMADIPGQGCGQGMRLGLCKGKWKPVWHVHCTRDKRAGGCWNQGSPSKEGARPTAALRLMFSPPLIHVLLASLAVAPWVKSTLFCTYGGEGLVHQLHAYCTTYTFCFLSGPSRAANACKLGSLLCSKNTDRRS